MQMRLVKNPSIATPERLRQTVRERAGYRCKYCRLPRERAKDWGVPHSRSGAFLQIRKQVKGLSKVRDFTILQC